MSHNDMKHYRSQLRHIVRPEKPSEREQNYVLIEDYEALYLHERCVEYAAYEAETADEEEIALGYAEYINKVVRDEGRNVVRMYAHTEAAREVLCAAAPTADDFVSDVLSDPMRERFHKQFDDGGE